MYKKLCVGEIVNTHGVKGELKVLPLVDNMTDLKDYFHYYIDDDKFDMETVRFHKDFALIKLKGIDDLDASEKYKGKFLELPREDLKPLPEGNYYICDLIGILVVDKRYGSLGTINDVFNTGSNDVYVITYKEKPLCIPVIEGVVKNVNLETRVMEVKVPDGILD